MFFNILATFAEFEVDLLRLRTREGMAIARAKGKLKGRAPKLSPPRQAHLVKLHTAGEHNIADLAELFEVSRNRSDLVHRVDRVADGAARRDPRLARFGVKAHRIAVVVEIPLLTP
jgi:DNA invertase Pin-like site-specific DNA recombinase